MKTARALVVLVAILAVAAAPVFAGVKYGKYDQADFTPPDAGDGDAITASAGGSVQLQASCHCADQPRVVPCSGSIAVEVDGGAGFTQAAAGDCTISEDQWCTLTLSPAFDTEGTFRFRIVCDEASGTDDIQGASEQVTVTVQPASTCTEGTHSTR